MIVLYKGFEGYSNRLFQNLHFEAYCLEKGIAYANPTFADIRRYYRIPPESKHAIAAAYFRSNVGQALIRRGFHKNVISFHRESGGDRSVLERFRDRNGYVSGWGFRVYELTEKHQDVFLRKYSLKPQYYAGNERLRELEERKRAGICTIGVHVRRGDYRTWKGGRYFFGDDVYREYMKNLEIEIQERCRKACAFMVFSNEPTSLGECANTCISENTWYVDHLLMSKCDYILGPPSTFSLWASYIGKTRYFHMFDDSGEIGVDRFRFCKG